MATVYDITARIQKRVQVKDYQPMEAEVTMKATLEEGDDHNAVVMNLMHEAHIAVLAGLKGTPPAKPSTTKAAEADDDEDEDETPAPKKAAKKAPAKKAAKPKPEPVEEDDEDEDEDEAPAPKKAAKPKPEPVEEDDEDEDEDEAPKKPAKKAAKPKPEPEESDDEDEDGDEDGDDGVMDENELQKYASSLIQTRKLSVGEVKGAIADLGVTHIRNLDAKGRAKLKANLDDLAAASGEEL